MEKDQDKNKKRVNKQAPGADSKQEQLESFQETSDGEFLTTNHGAKVNHTDDSRKPSRSPSIPGHVVPGIDFTNDPLLRGRLFSYIDTQLTRQGGPNFNEIPINRPVSGVHNNQRDGFTEKFRTAILEHRHWGREAHTAMVPA